MVWWINTHTHTRGFVLSFLSYNLCNKSLSFVWLMSFTSFSVYSVSEVVLWIRWLESKPSTLHPPRARRSASILVYCCLWRPHPQPTQFKWMPTLNVFASNFKSILSVTVEEKMQFGLRGTSLNLFFCCLFLPGSVPRKRAKTSQPRNNAAHNSAKMLYSHFLHFVS